MCKEYVKDAWHTLIEALKKVDNEGAGTIALELAEKAQDIWENGVVTLTKFGITDENGAEIEGMTVASKKPDGVPPAIIITPTALKTKHKLLETLLHELLHAAGLISEDETEDEELTEYLTKELMKKIIDAASAKLPDPLPCTPGNSQTGISGQVIIRYLKNHPNSYLLANKYTLKDVINNIRGPSKMGEITITGNQEHTENC